MSRMTTRCQSNGSPGSTAALDQCAYSILIPPFAPLKVFFLPRSLRQPANILQPNYRQGQANHFLRFAKEKIPYGIQRYVGESERLYGILNTRLADRDYLVGPGRGKYSIADISALGWANIAILSGIDLHKLFPNVVAWLDRCMARPGTKRGFAVPQESSFANAAFLKKIEEDPEAKKSYEETTKLLNDAKEQYNYKFASP